MRKCRLTVLNGFHIVCDNEEIEIGLFCVAAPVLDISGKVVATISVSCPKYSILGSIEEFIALVTQTARDISEELGDSTQRTPKPS